MTSIVWITAAGRDMIN